MRFFSSTYLVKWTLRFSLCILILTPHVLQAQREYFNWYFGSRAGITFNTTPASTLTDGQHIIYHNPATISDSAGHTLFVTDGARIWNRQGQPMAGTFSSGCSWHDWGLGPVLIARQPDSRNLYYIFCRRFKQLSPNSCQYKKGIYYCIVDMQRAGGMGEVVSTDSLPTTAAGAALPAVSAVRQQNGRDLWLVMKTDLGKYLSYAFTPAGIAPHPVISQGPRFTGLSPGESILKVSPSGRALAALTQRGPSGFIYTLEIADFDPANGTVSHRYTLPSEAHGLYRDDYPGGMEFSPDGSKLYVDTISGRGLMQFDLLAGSPAAVAASRIWLRPASGNTRGNARGIQLGPDGQLYVAGGYRTYLGRVEHPNARGGRALYNDTAIYLGANRGNSFDLPYATNDLNLPPVLITGAGSVTVRTGCAGQPIDFTSTLSPFVSASTYVWDFGDPGSGPANSAAGQAPSHVYRQAGAYTVTLQVNSISGQRYSTTQTVQVLPVPVVQLPNDSIWCNDDSRLLRPGVQPDGSSFQWSDGSTLPFLSVSAPGLYWVEVMNALGCPSRDTIILKSGTCDAVLPNVITPNGDGLNDSFILTGRQPAQWSCRFFSRWGQCVYKANAYANNWQADGLPAGAYYYVFTSSDGVHHLKGWVEVVR